MTSKINNKNKTTKKNNYNDNQNNLEIYGFTNTKNSITNKNYKIKGKKNIEIDLVNTVKLDMFGFVPQ
jgi:hypothetical protein